MDGSMEKPHVSILTHLLKSKLKVIGTKKFAIFKKFGMSKKYNKMTGTFSL